MEESLAAGVRRMRTSPGFFMRKREIVACWQRSAGCHHAAMCKNTAGVTTQSGTHLLGGDFTAFHITNRWTEYSPLLK